MEIFVEVDTRGAERSFNRACVWSFSFRHLSSPCPALPALPLLSFAVTGHEPGNEPDAYRQPDGQEQDLSEAVLCTEAAEALRTAA